MAETTASFERRQTLRRLPRETLRDYQLNRLRALLGRVLPQNRFYRAHFAADTLQIDSLERWAELPAVRKSQLVSAEGDAAAHHTFAPEAYVRLHRTSGTRGRPMIVMDTAEDWQWWLDTWQYVWDAAEVRLCDAVMMAFSFGPFVGFWSAFDAAVQRGLMTVPGGGLSTAARLDLMASAGCNILCCTPSYALHLAEESQRQGVDPQSYGIVKIIVAGEPGGSIVQTRQRIESLWGARVVDHAGATEVGPWGVGTPDGRDLFVVESEFIAEFDPIDAVDPDGPSELILTALGRGGAPVLRYRTGDVVKPVFPQEDASRRPEGGLESNFVRLEGGILGRVDDMMIIRGVNVFPSSIESILRRFPEVSEFRITATRRGQMDDLKIEVEDASHEPARIADRFAIDLGLRVAVVDCPAGTLPRFEGKARRFVDLRRG